MRFNRSRTDEKPGSDFPSSQPFDCKLYDFSFTLCQSRGPLVYVSVPAVMHHALKPPEPEEPPQAQDYRSLSDCQDKSLGL